MKRAIALLLSIVLLITGCSSPSPKADSTEPISSTEAIQENRSNAETLVITGSNSMCIGILFRKPVGL